MPKSFNSQSISVVSRRAAVAMALSLGLVATIRADEPAEQPAADDAVTLAYKFEANQSLHFEFTQQMTMDIKKGDVKQHIECETIAHKHLRIIAVDTAGNALVEPVIDRTRMKSRDDGQLTEFDSEEGVEGCPQQFRRLLDSIGKPMVRAKFTAHGKVLEATAVNGGSKAAQGLQDDATLNFLVVFPERAVRVGDTWSEDFEVLVQIDRKLKQPIKLRRQYRLTKREGSEVVIEMKLGSITPINSAEVELQVASRLVSGTIVFDHVAGRIVRRELSVDRQVLNPLGPGSLVRTTLTQIETATTAPASVARREETARD